MFTIKICLTLFIVLLLTEISKRVKPAVGGILMGLPLGAGLSTYFLAFEQGIPFLLEAIPGGIFGLSSSLLFSLSYYLADRWLVIKNRLLSSIVSSCISILVYALVSVGGRMLNLSLGSSLLITVTMIAGNLLVVRWLIPPSIKPPTKKLSFTLLFIRAFLTALTIAVITGIAHLIGPVWAGILSAFPIVLFQVLVFLHVEEGPQVYPGIITGFAYSVTNLLLFYLMLAFLLPKVGLNLTFLLVYVFSAIFLYLLNRVRH